MGASAYRCQRLGRRTANRGAVSHSRLVGPRRHGGGARRDRRRVSTAASPAWPLPAARALTGEENGLARDGADAARRGYSGETFLAEAGGDRVVVRIYRRNPERAAIDASLLRLVRGIIPVADVLEVRPATADLPAVLVTEHLDGTALDQVLRADPPGLDWETLGLNLGWVLGSLSSIPFLRFGMFADADLTIARAGMSTDLAAWAQHFRDTGRLAAWAEPDWHKLQGLIDIAERTLDDRQNETRVVLAHSDFNPKNILIDPTDCGIVGVLDWEFAHAGSIHTDLRQLHPVRARRPVGGPADRGFRGPGAGPHQRAGRARACDGSLGTGRTGWRHSLQRCTGSWRRNCCWRRRANRACGPGRGTLLALTPRERTPYPSGCALGLRDLRPSRLVLVLLIPGPTAARNTRWDRDQRAFGVHARPPSIQRSSTPQ